MYISIQSFTFWYIISPGNFSKSNDRHAVGRQLKPGDTVYVRSFGQGPTWIPGHVLKELSPVSYTVTLDEKQLVWRCHVDHIRKRLDSLPPKPKYSESSDESTTEQIPSTSATNSEISDESETLPTETVFTPR